VAEEKAAPAEAPVTMSAPPAQRPTLFIILAIVNMLIVAGVGTLLYMGKKKEAERATIDKVIEGEAKTQTEESAKESEYIGTLIPMETFLVNLSGSRGGKLARINMELEVSSTDVQEEIDKRKPQIRDIIIILLSSKTFQQISNRDGKEQLRNEIKDTVNPFLTKGQIKRVYFTEFILN
jgi:flagellar FliL protein